MVLMKTAMHFLEKELLLMVVFEIIQHDTACITFFYAILPALSALIVV